MRRSRAAQARAPLNRPLAPSADMPTADRELLSCGFLRPICADLHQQPTRLATTGAFAPQIQGSAPCSKAFPQILDGEILTVRGFLACVSQDPVCDFFFFFSASHSSWRREWNLGLFASPCRSGGASKRGVSSAPYDLYDV